MNKPILTRAALIGLLLALLVIAVDQVSKAWILYGLSLPEHGQIKVLPFLSLTLERNYSMSFGLLGTGAWARLFLLVFPFVASSGLIYVLRTATSTTVGLALGFIIGGALGNGFDRIRLGWVVDFLDVSSLNFPWIFNVADSAINVGVALLLFHYLMGRKPTNSIDASA